LDGKDMKKSKKYSLAILIEVILITIFNFGYGMIIGGAPNLKYNIIAILLSALSLSLLFKFKFDKIDILITICVFTISILLFNFSYSFINELFADDSSTIEYTTQVVDYKNHLKSTYIDVYFEDSNKNLTEYSTDIDGIDLEDEDFDRIIGSEIKVKETNGLFNYPVYKIEYDFDY
jgi:hypothetical protein